jgi:hypothetical protein
MDKQFDVNCILLHPSFNKIESPFYQYDNKIVNHFVDNKDNKPEDGWELIYRNFGYDDDGNPNSHVSSNNPFLILYNKYLGLLRVFTIVANNKEAYFYGKIKMRFIPGYEHVTTSLLDLGISDSIKPFRALNDFPPRASGIDFNNYSMLNITSRTMNSSLWFYADFPVNYDPCTCLFKSKLLLEIEFITQADILLSGAMNNVVAYIKNRSGYNSSSKIDDTSSSLTLTGFGSNIIESYRSFGRFNSGMKKYIKEIHKNDSLKKENSLASLIVFNDTLSEGLATDALKIMPEVGNITEMLDYFIIGGKTYPTRVQHMPISIQSNLAVSGTISSIGFQSIIFWNPGSNFTSTPFDDREYPIYDQVLGTFNILRSPKVAINKSSNIDCQSRNSLIFRNKRFNNKYTISDTFTVNFSEPIQYVLNPVAFSTKPDDVTIFASIEFELEPSKSIYVWRQNINATGLEHVKGNTYRTKYYPVQCLTDDFFKFVVTTNATDFWHKEKCGKPSDNPIKLSNLKVRLLNFYKRNDLDAYPNADDILEARTYAIDDILYTENTNDNDDYSISGYHESLVLKDTVISTDITAWGDIEIGENVTVSGSNTYFIRSIYGSCYVKDGAKLVPNLKLQSGYKSACITPMYGPVGHDEVMNFCQSNTKDGYRPEIRKMGPNSIFYADELDNPNMESSNTVSMLVFPTPAHSSVNIKFDLSVTQNIKIVITNTLGEILAIPVDKSHHNAGLFTIPVDVSHFSSGVYFCTMYSPAGIITKSFMVLR